jgi:1A family penicillin-binding protein
MKLIIFVINLFLSVLNLIGDFVIFYFLIFINFIVSIIKLSKQTFINFKSKYKLIFNQFRLKELRFKNLIKLTEFKLFLDFKDLKRKFHLRKFRKFPKAKVLKEKKAVSVAPKHVFLRIEYFILGFIFCIVFIVIPISIYIFLNSLPNPKQLSERQIPQTTKIYDRNNTLLYQIYANENRTLVPLSTIPQDLVNATIAIEDKDFYKNPGFDINGIARAFIADVSGKPIQGGSTITQQLIKSTLLTPEISITRKVKEIILAFWAEKIYTKNQILEMYFNQVPYGGTAWGIEAASETYFGKNVKDLDLAQCAFLAGMPQAPTIYSPYGENPNLWRKRQKEVLEKMLDQNYIDLAQEEQALSENLNFQPPQTPIYAPHFVMYIKDYLVQRYGLPLVEKGGLNVTTTLDLNLQKRTEEIVANEVNQNAYLNLTNGAALVTTPGNGDILAMVGSKNYDDENDGNVNLTTSLRQPGSSIKLVTYAAALSDGFTAATILEDTPITYYIPGSTPYSPVNYDGAFHGKIPLRIAFANSFNIPAVKTLQKIGIPEMIDLAKKMGITTWGDPSQYGLSITLGAAEVKMVDLATAYGVIANSGKKVSLNPILTISNYQQGTIYKKQEELPQQVLDPGVTYIISNILADNSARSWEFGSNSPLNIPGHTVSVKTGTTDNKRDNWTFGFTPNYLVAVWVGNNDNTPMSPNLASGITGAAPIWNKIMTMLLGNTPDTPLQIPNDIVQKTCFGKKEYFIKGNENCPLVATPSATLEKRS